MLSKCGLLVWFPLSRAPSPVTDWYVSHFLARRVIRDNTSLAMASSVCGVGCIREPTCRSPTRPWPQATLAHRFTEYHTGGKSLHLPELDSKRRVYANHKFFPALGELISKKITGRECKDFLQPTVLSLAASDPAYLSGST